MVGKHLIQVDVFTTKQFGGNQLAVVLDAEGLSDTQMQAIAREMNYSETTFVLPAETPDALCRVRIFTPATELPLAGHPVVGTAWVLAREGRIPLAASTPAVSAGSTSSGAPAFTGHATLQLKIGLLGVDVLGTGQSTPTFVWMEQPVPESRPWQGNPAHLLAALNVAPNDLDPRLPIMWASAGVPYVYVLLRSREAVGRAEPGLGLRAALAASGEGEAGVYVFALDEETGGTHGRMFAPHLGVLEDAATGSAAGPLGVVLTRATLLSPSLASGSSTELGQRSESPGSGTVTFRAEQGVEMRRPSSISVQISSSGQMVERVRVGGPSVLVADDTLMLDE